MATFRADVSITNTGGIDHSFHVVMFALVGIVPTTIDTRNITIAQGQSSSYSKSFSWDISGTHKLVTRVFDQAGGTMLAERDAPFTLEEPVISAQITSLTVTKT